MYTRTHIVDSNFRQRVKEQQLPESPLNITPDEVGLHSKELIELFQSQAVSRHLDFAARELRAENKAFYTIGSSGHEGNAVIGKVFRHTDMAFLHYRSCALYVQRARQLPNSDPIREVLLSLVAAADDPIAGGRHKVFGSVPLNIPPQTSTIASHLPKAVGCALSIGKAKKIAVNTLLPEDSVVLCSFGDASLNHSTALGALNTASWCNYQNIPLPIVFLCEDNGIGISVKTPRGWVAQTIATRPALKYFGCDGLDVLDTYRQATAALNYARQTGKPAFLHMQLVRLLGHAGSDIESTYHSVEEIQQSEALDPLLFTAKRLIQNNILQSKEVLDLYESARAEVHKRTQEVKKAPQLTGAREIMQPIVPLVKKSSSKKKATEKERQAMFGKEYTALKTPQHMGRLLNWALTDILLEYPNTLIFGEDVAQKGGVYHVTAGLRKRFGPNRIFNSPLDEQSILGTAIGLAHNGFLPIPEIQYLAYFHNAEDQIRGEAATLPFFSKGQYANPMVVRIPGLAYQKGFGGHFHNDNSLAVFRDIPGLILACPSNGADAVAMLRESVRLADEEGRVVIFIEPIARYMTKDLHEKGDELWCAPYPKKGVTIPLGEFGVYGNSKEFAMITFGNGTYLCYQAEKTLREQHGIETKIIDLRWLMPIDEKKLASEVKGIKNLLIVDECRRTGSLSEALVTMLVENLTTPPKISRLTAADSFIPLGPAADFVLPSKQGVVNASLELLR